MQNSSALKVPAAVDERHAIPQLVRGPFPETNAGCAHHPLAVGGVQIDGRVVKGPAPLDHRGIKVGMRNGDGANATQLLDTGEPFASSSNVTQSHRRFPPGDCTSNARCPIAKEGSVPMPKRLSPSASIDWNESRDWSSVVHSWPFGLMNCRSSSQIGQLLRRLIRFAELGAAGDADMNCSLFRWPGQPIPAYQTKNPRIAAAS